MIASFQCKAGKAQTIYWDAKTPCLGLRVTSSGTKSYIFETSLNNKTIRITIGDVRIYSILNARAEVTALKSMTDKGIDPRQVRDEEKKAIIAKLKAKQYAMEAQLLVEKKESLTLGKIWPLYIAARRKRWSEWSIRDHENIAGRGGVKKVRGKGLTEPGPLAPLLDVRLSDLTGILIGKWMAKEAEIRPTRTALAFRLLSGFINWCESQEEYAGLVPQGACKAQQVRDEMPNKNTKEGDCLQREQLALWFTSVKRMTNQIQSAYLQTLLITGARRRELAALRWEDVDFRWLSMTIRDKVEGERTIPLTPYVAHLLTSLPKNSEWVFSSPTSANGQLADPRHGHKRALLDAGLPDLTIHGLRRSFGSLAEWTEVPAGVVAQIMGHKPSAIAEKHYRRRPLDLLRSWHIKIETWLLEQAGIKFVPLQTGLNIVSVD